MMRFLTTAFAAMFVLASPVLAQDVIGHYDHNSSRMVAIGSEDSGGVTIQYVEPKRALGIASGAWLFKGTVDDDGNFSGSARVFNDKCSPAEYHVTGRYYGDDIVLEGEAPIWGKDCSVIGFKWSNEHSYLRFDAIQ
jgi:hypothetical protein